MDWFWHGENIFLFAEGIGSAEDDLVGDSLLEDFFVQLGLDGIGAVVDLGLQSVLGIGLAGLHDVGEEELDVEDVLATFLVDILRIHVGQLVGATFQLQLRRHLLLRAEGSFHQFVVGTEIGQTLLVDSELQRGGDVVLTGVGLAPREDALRAFGTLIDLEGLVLEFGTYPTTKVAVFLRLVLVEYAHDGTVIVGGQVHQAFDGVLRHHTVVDVGHQVADTVEHHQVGLIAQHQQFEQGETVGHGLAADIEHIYQIRWKLVLGDACEGYDTIAQDVLRRLLALFGIIPQHVQTLGLDPFDGEQLTAKAEGHENGRYEGLAAFGLSRQSRQLATGKAGLAEQPEQELHGWELRMGCDASSLRLLQALFLFAGDACQVELRAD